MFTVAAQRSRMGLESVAGPADLRGAGWSKGAVHAQLAARRWQRFGRAVVLHGGPLTPDDRRGIALMNCGDAPALVVAASTFPHPRSACGVLAAGVQQRLVTADHLRAALEQAPRTRHHRFLCAAVDDIAQGAHAMSEIDFGRLCRHAGLPAPTRQVVRVEPGGRRRYLDTEWVRSDGRRVVVEVDGALRRVLS